MMPPSGCSPIAPNVSTSRRISAGPTLSPPSVMCLPQCADALQPCRDVTALKALVAWYVELPAREVVRQVALRPPQRVIFGKVVAVAIVAAVTHAAHESRHRVAQVQRHR